MQSLVIKWLEQVVDGIQLECLHSVLVVGSDKDHSGHSLRANFAHYIEAGAVR